MKMELERKDGRTFIKIGRFFSIPCQYEGSRYIRTFTVFKKKLTVSFYDVEGVIRIYPFLNSDFHILLKIAKKSMKYRHFQKLKDKEDPEYILKEIKDITKEKLNYEANILKPESFNEKIIWTKIHDHNPLVTVCCDKYALKEYVKEKIGSQYILPVLKTWQKAEDIDFESLPGQFVLKVNWSSGYNIIVKDKNQLHKEAVRELIDCWMKPASNSYYHFFNWGYKDVKPIIYAEKYIEEEDGQLHDYKLFMNKGKLKFILMASDRYGEEEDSLTYYDSEFHKLPFHRGNKENKDIRKPEHFDKMVKLAEILSEPFQFVRVDFYEDNKSDIYVGEMTFYTGGGLTRFHPREWDYKLGQMIDLT